MNRPFFRPLLPLFFTLFAAGFAARAQPLPDRFPFAGTALDSAGKPLEGAIITLRRLDSNGAFTFWGAVAASDARGGFRLAQAETGRYYLSAQAPGFAPISNLPIDWEIGAKPLQLRFERLVALHLKLAAPGGAPAANAALYLRLRGTGGAGQTSRRTTTDERGEVTFDDLLPATYALFLAAPQGYALQNSVEMRADKSLDLQLQTGGNLQIRVAPNDGISPKNGEVLPLGGASLNLTPEDSLAATQIMGSGADPSENVAYLAAGGDFLSLLSRDGDGQIAIGNLPPGRYRARLNLPGYAAPEAQIVRVTADETARLQFVLSTPPGATKAAPRAALTLDLRVKNTTGETIAAPAGEWSVRALPIEENGALAPEAREGSALDPIGNVSRRALSDANGRLTLFPLRVGRYRIFVAPRTPAGAAILPEAASLDISVPANGANAILVVPAAP